MCKLRACFRQALRLPETAVSAPGARRVPLLDLWRFAALCLMLAYHLLWDLEHFGALPAGLCARPWALALRDVCGGSFILVSGAAVCHSRDPARRGCFVFGAGLLVSGATALLGLPVRFGILHLLGSCMLLYALPGMDRALRPRPGLIWVCLGLFALSALLTAQIRVDITWIYPIGLRHPDFYSADYWPLLPWVFLFALGAALEPSLARARQPRLPRAAAWISRHSLALYLLHQPLLYGLCWLLLGR